MLGAPGAGKGTQAHYLAETLRIPHISSGDIFRSHVENSTALGQKLQPYMSTGQLVPDALACEIIADRLTEDDCADGYILDGFPRSTPQAEELSRQMSERGNTLDIAINLEVDDDEIVSRLANRRSCPDCGHIYNLITLKPTRENQCDTPECNGSALVQREDDQEETIRKRLNIYHETTEPIVQYYDSQGILKSIACSGRNPDQIAEAIDEVLA